MCSIPGLKLVQTSLLLSLLAISTKIFADDIEIYYPSETASVLEGGINLLFVDKELVNSGRGGPSSIGWGTLSSGIREFVQNYADIMPLTLVSGSIDVGGAGWILSEVEQFGLGHLKGAHSDNRTVLDRHRQQLLEGIERLSEVATDGLEAKTISFTRLLKEIASSRSISSCELKQVVVMVSKEKADSLGEVAVSGADWVMHQLIVDSSSLGVSRRLLNRSRSGDISSGFRIGLARGRDIEAVLGKLWEWSRVGVHLDSPSKPIVNAFALSSYQTQSFLPLYVPATTQFSGGNLLRVVTDDDSGSVGAGGGWKDASNKAVSAGFRRRSTTIGSELDRGGVVSHLNRSGAPRCSVGGRPIYTYTGDYIEPSAKNGWVYTPDNRFVARLNRSEHCLNPTEAVSEKMLTSAVRDLDKRAFEAVVGAAAGDPSVVSGQLPKLGSVLHSTPTLVNYGLLERFDAHRETTENRSSETIFFSTNQGFMHAVNAATGKELFSFIPQEMLPRLVDLYRNPIAVTRSERLVFNEHFYGLDGRWVAWRRDAWERERSGRYHRDGLIDQSKNPKDHVYLYAGMRRGGYNYYALDVSSLQAGGLSVRDRGPRLKFVIKGGDQVARENPYHQMGQTWSTPVLGQVRYGGQIRTVLFFGGGYDAKRYDRSDSDQSSYESSYELRGNQIYMVDADSGALLWWASGQNSGADLESQYLQHSIPAKLKVLDLNGNGLVDRIYFGDLGGQLFRLEVSDRVDLETEQSKKDFASLARVATLGGEDENDRRFFETPSVALLSDGSRRSLLSIAIASGDRTSPRGEAINDYLFVLHDSLDLTDKDRLPDGGYTLQELTRIAGDRKLDEAVVRESKRSGWAMPFSAVGEKAMSSPLFFEGQLLLATYIPDVGSKALSLGRENFSKHCRVKQSAMGYSRLYILEGIDGGAGARFNGFAKEQTGSSGRYLDRAALGAVAEIYLKIGQQQDELVVGDKTFSIGPGNQLEFEYDKKQFYRRGWQSLP